MLASKMNGGGVGVAVKGELILLHNTIDMTANPVTALLDLSTSYVEIVEAWRDICSSVTNLSGDDWKVKLINKLSNISLAANQAKYLQSASKACAEENLKVFGEVIGVSGLVFDENNTCILGVDEKFSMHLTYEPNNQYLYLYSPLLDGLPEHAEGRLKLYELLLEGSMLGGKMAGGGVGVAVKEELILMHCVLDMKNAPEDRLKRFAPLYVEIVEKWRETCSELLSQEQYYDTLDIIQNNKQFTSAQKVAKTQIEEILQKASKGRYKNLNWECGIDTKTHKTYAELQNSFPVTSQNWFKKNLKYLNIDFLPVDDRKSKLVIYNVDLASFGHTRVYDTVTTGQSTHFSSQDIGSYRLESKIKLQVETSHIDWLRRWTQLPFFAVRDQNFKVDAVVSVTTRQEQIVCQQLQKKLQECCRFFKHVSGRKYFVIEDHRPRTCKNLRF